MNRRRFAAGLLALGFAPALGAQPGRTVRFGVTAVFLNDRLRMLRRWQSALESLTGYRIEFVQRAGYGPVIDGLRAGQIDVAWICGYPYVLHASELRLLAVPVWRGRPLYQSYLIAGAQQEASGLADLRGRNFAFSDPLSNSGHLYIRYLLAQQGQRVEEYFGRAFFAHSHANVAEAVADGLADGGAIDGYVWEVLNEINPALTARTRVLERSPDFGFPPIVAAAHVDAATRARLQAALLAMGQAADGRAVLDELRLDRYEAAASPALYASILRMAKAVG